jgi:hypothetical protein
LGDAKIEKLFTFLGIAVYSTIGIYGDPVWGMLKSKSNLTVFFILIVAYESKLSSLD